MGKSLEFGAEKGQIINKDGIEKIFTNDRGYDFNYFAKVVRESKLL